MVQCSCVIVCGVCGSGKSTVGAALAARLGWQFVDGDDHHAPAAVAKMAAGEPLTEADRAPWLAALAARAAAEPPAVLACSALRRAHRDALRAGSAPGAVRFVLLAPPEAELAARLAARRGHFAGPALLPSQLATLEAGDGNEFLARFDGDAALAGADALAAAVEERLAPSSPSSHE